MRAPGQPLGIENCNCFMARKAARQITRLYDAYLQPTGLRITQFLILAALNELHQATVNELAAHLDVERTAMGKMLGFLERDGLLSIRPSETDGRSRTVELTKQGSSLYRKAQPLWQDAQGEFARLNGPDLVGALRQGFSNMVALST